MTLLRHSRAVKVTEVAVTRGRDKVFDEAGDLELHIGKGTSKTVFIVSSYAMAKASPIWRNMIFGGNISGKWVNSELKHGNGEKPVLVLEIGPLPAMKAILAWIHLDFDFEPQYQNTEFLYGLAMIIDYYELANVVKPMMAKWNSYLSCLVSANPFDDWKAWENNDYRVNVQLSPAACNEQPIPWIAWVFGREDIIDEAMKHAIKNFDCDNVGVMFKPNDRTISVQQDSHKIEIQNRIIGARSTIAHSMLAPYRNTLLTLLKRPSDRKSDEIGCCMSDDSIMQGMCERTLAGSLATKLHRLLWTDRNPSINFSYEISIEKLYEGLQAIDLDGIEETWNAHKVCNPTKSMKASLHREYNKISSLLEDQERAKLKDRRDLWGYKLTMDMPMGEDEDDDESDSDYEGFFISDMLPVFEGANDM